MRRRRADGLFDGMATFGALCAAASRAALGKRRGPGPAAFLANLETEVLACAGADLRARERLRAVRGARRRGSRWRRGGDGTTAEALAPPTAAPAAMTERGRGEHPAAGDRRRGCRLRWGSSSESSRGGSGAGPWTGGGQRETNGGTVKQVPRLREPHGNGSRNRQRLGSDRGSGAGRCGGGWRLLCHGTTAITSSSGRRTGSASAFRRRVGNGSAVAGPVACRPTPLARGPGARLRGRRAGGVDGRICHAGCVEGVAADHQRSPGSAAEVAPSGDDAELALRRGPREPSSAAPRRGRRPHGTRLHPR